MSRTSKSVSENPCKKYLTWKSDAKSFQYWDKDSKENVNVALPVNFVLLSRQATVRGWSDDKGGAFWSPGVALEKIQIKPMTVKVGKETFCEGLWKDIKAKVVSAGGKYAEGVYALDLDTKEIVCFTLSGSSLTGGSKKDVPAKGGWMKYTKETDNLYKNIVSVEEFIEEKNKAIKFYVPVFKKGAELTQAQSQLADDADVLLQQYLNRNTSEDAPKSNDVVLSETESEDSEY